MPQYFYHIGIELFDKDSPSPINLSQAFRALKPFTSTRPRSIRELKYDTARTPHSQQIASQIVPSSPDDQRVDEIYVESTDMDSITTGIGTSIASAQTRARFTEVEGGGPAEYGIVHLYRDAEETPGLYHEHQRISSSDLVWNGSASARLHLPSNKSIPPPKDDECSMLSILAVPSYLTPKDFLAFVGQDTRNAVSHFRMIRTSRLNRYMVLMKFKDGRFARQWQQDWNGKVFNSVEPETCHVVFIKSVDVLHNRDLQSARERAVSSAAKSTASNATDKSLSLRPSLGPSNKPLAPPTPSLVELPTCPVCLERMDESTGLLTILCQHVFHCSCLEKWSGGGCPVCRYSHDDFSTGAAASRAGKAKKYLDSRGEYEINDEVLECSECRLTQTLWQCLICGYIGCGRYAGKHAYKHYEQTSHTFALDLESQRVWDYDRDCYVHRIIANGSSTNGEKLIEIPGRRRDGQPTALEDIDRDLDIAKRENLAFEYTQLLTSQLESQRIYFEEVLARAADKAADASKRAERAVEEVTAAQARLEATLRSSTELHEKFKDLEKEAMRAQSRNKQLQDSTKTLKDKNGELETLSELQSKKIKALETDLRTVSSRLSKEQEDRLRILEEECATKNFFIEALQEERRDLRVRLDAEQQILNLVKSGQLSWEDLEGATVEVGPSGRSSLKNGKQTLRSNKPAASASSIQKSKQSQQHRADPTDEQVEEQIKIATLETKHAAEQEEIRAKLGELFNGAYKVNGTMTSEQITQALLEKGVIEHKEETGLYDDSDVECSDDSGAQAEADAKRKARRKKRNKKKK
ncbi:hypothetical protein H2198_009419 [Neophaeococcomyces mojaviensis]|uniref:Uncharacterized protein n=1 Tax=Neophaeococcomyces mojaviensis TaxID=3383035 RepID=A0ACC2ZV38_9EURO|nr:hypothetical protein H2198_009419 [Knufia sp. JES_112]